MNDRDFNIVWGEALRSSDRDTYISEWATSSIWGLPEDLTDDDLTDIATKLGNIWDAAHMSVKEICKAAGLTQACLAQKLCAPLSTVENWCRGVNKCPNYTRLMILEKLGLLVR